jgi:hypothetical protein
LNVTTQPGSGSGLKHEHLSIGWDVYQPGSKSPEVGGIADNRNAVSSDQREQFFPRR